LDTLDKYLLRHYHATKHFSQAVQKQDAKGNLNITQPDFRNLYVEQLHNFDLKPICKLSIDSIMEVASSASVRLISDPLKNLILIGRLFKAIERFGNYVIQYFIDRNLPNILEDSINNGIEITNPNHLPSAIYIVNFLKKKLTYLNKSLENTIEQENHASES